MDVFGRVAGEDYEQVVFNYDRSSGLRAIIVIHSTALGPAAGGVRFKPYPSVEDAARDAVRFLRRRERNFSGRKHRCDGGDLRRPAHWQ